MHRFLCLFTLLISASITSASTLEGNWEGDGQVTYTQSSKNLEPCTGATIKMTWAEPDLVVTDFETCIVEWDKEPLTFINGQVFRRGLLIGNYDHQNLRFEYHSLDTGLAYSVKAWIENETLVMEELFEVPNLWWSKGYYKFQRK